MTAPELIVGSLCSGYGGLDLGLALAADQPVHVAWHAEVDDAPSRILTARFPGVPNLGDLTATDWSTLPPVDVITAGYPCQPFSTAGKRQGTTDARHLWLTSPTPDVDIPRTAQLKALGNGVVPQQAAYAWAHLTAHDHALGGAA